MLQTFGLRLFVAAFEFIEDGLNFVSFFEGGLVYA